MRSVKRRSLQSTTHSNDQPTTSYNRDHQRDTAKKENQGQRKDLAIKSTSKNMCINRSQIWRPEDGPLCYQCGHLGHVKKNRKDEIVSIGEQSYLEPLVFG